MHDRESEHGSRRGTKENRRCEKEDVYRKEGRRDPRGEVCADVTIYARRLARWQIEMPDRGDDRIIPVLMSLVAINGV